MSLSMSAKLTRFDTFIFLVYIHKNYILHKKKTFIFYNLKIIFNFQITYQNVFT